MATTDLATTSRDGFKEAERTVRDYVCGDCGGRLTAIWRGDRYAAVCARWPDEHEHLRSHAEAAADDLRQRLEDNPKLAQTLAMHGAPIPLTSQALRSLSDEQLRSRVEVKFADMGDATPALRGQIIALCKTYLLDPVFDLMIYQGRPYITYEGRLRKLRESAYYRGHKVRPLLRDEKEAWSFKPEDIVVVCEVDMGSHGTVTDFGVVRAVGEVSPVARQHPQQLAIKRAVARASRQAVGIDLPTFDVGVRSVIDITEEPQRRTALEDGETMARKRFWATARGAPPNGFGLTDEQAHELLGVETLSGYPGGWDQALSDLTEKIAERESSPEDRTAPTTSAVAEGRGEGAASSRPSPAASMQTTLPADDAAFDEAVGRNRQLAEDARAIGVLGVDQFVTKRGWTLERLSKANAELSERIKSHRAF
jgi:hypothetical protein